MTSIPLTDVVYDQSIYPRAEWSQATVNRYVDLSCLLAGDVGTWRANQTRADIFATATLAANGCGGWSAEVIHCQLGRAPYKNCAEGYFCADVIPGLLGVLGFGEPGSTTWKRIETARNARSVYFIEAENGLIKIGVSDDPVGRLAQIKTMSPLPLKLLGLIPGAGDVGEAEFHRRFADDREHGEWFRPSPALTSYIAAHAVKAGAQ